MFFKITKGMGPCERAEVRCWNVTIMIFTPVWVLYTIGFWGHFFGFW